MKPLLSYVLGISLALASAFTCAAAPPATVACDSAYVTQAGNVITVLPTGISDTLNLQCAFDIAVAAGVSTDVRLVAGTYHTAQVFAFGFHGRWLGAGADKTVVKNLPNLYVTPVNSIVEPPSATNPHPFLFSFIDGDIVITNLSIRIVGGEPTTGWAMFDSPQFKALAVAVAIEGTYANAWIDKVIITGEKNDALMFGYNLYNGVYFEGVIGNPPPLLSGSYKVTNSTFRTLADGSPVYNVTDASILISHNRYEDTMYGVEAGFVFNSVYEISHNTVENAVFGISEWGDFESTKLLIRNNTVRNSVYGIMLEGPFGEGNECLLLGNNVQKVTDTGIFLGASTKGCTVVGGSNKTNVVDNGTDNVLVGVNNMGTGVGPTIKHFMRMMK